MESAVAGHGSSSDPGRRPSSTKGLTNWTLVSRYRDYLGELIKNDKRSVLTGIRPLMGSDEVAEVRAE